MRRILYRNRESHDDAHRLNYAYDLRVFFQFLSKKKWNKDVLSITLDDMNSLDASDIEIFVSSLSLYEINGKREHCSERGKARKLATVRSFFKYFFNKGKLESNVAGKSRHAEIAR